MMSGSSRAAAFRPPASIRRSSPCARCLPSSGDRPCPRPRSRGRSCRESRPCGRMNRESTCPARGATRAPLSRRPALPAGDRTARADPAAS
jgi:hypothetical protein